MYISFYQRCHIFDGKHHMGMQENGQDIFIHHRLKIIQHMTKIFLGDVPHKKLYSSLKMDNYDQFQILTRNPIYNFSWFLWVFPIKDMTTLLNYIF